MTTKRSPSQPYSYAERSEIERARETAARAHFDRRDQVAAHEAGVRAEIAGGPPASPPAPPAAFSEVTLDQTRAIWDAQHFAAHEVVKAAFGR